MKRLNIHTVEGRLAIIAKCEDIDAGLHQLHLHLQNLETQMAFKDQEIQELRKLLSSKKRHDASLDRFATLERIVRAVWKDGASIYADEIQELVATLEL